MARSGLTIGLLVLCIGALGASAQAQTPRVNEGRLIASGGGPGAATACFSCHGMDGAGDAGGGFPRLAGLGARYLAKQLENYADGSRPNDIMTPIALALSAQQRQAVARFYADLPPRRAPFPAAGDSADSRLLQRGATLYAVGSQSLGVQACVTCHGPGGKGMGFIFPAVGGQPAHYVSEQLRLWREGTRTNDQAGMMRTVASRLQDEDVRALGLYLQSMPP